MKLVSLMLISQSVGLHAFTPSLMSGHRRMDTSLEVKKQHGFIENMFSPVGVAIISASIVLYPGNALAKNDMMISQSAGS